MDSHNKRLIICADGTWNKPDQKDRGKRKPTNIVKIMRAIKPIDDKGVHQVVFYNEGVGTGGFMDKLGGGLLGKGLSKNIVECYRFLVNNYTDGDEIYLFGFSRGAYTVRSLAGFICKGGILPKDEDFFTVDLYNLYRTQAYQSTFDEFKKKHDSRNANIYCLGVWDTVGSRGIPLKFNTWSTRKKFQFHDTELHQKVKNAFHAVSIDEKRKPFQPTLWEGNFTARNVDQKWFAGVHSNIGGGYERDGLANITLHWMVKNIAPLGLTFDLDFLDFYKWRYDNDMRNSLSLLYRLLRPVVRKIKQLDKTNIEICIHETAMKRYENLESYKPINLKKYLDNFSKKKP